MCVRLFYVLTFNLASTASAAESNFLAPPSIVSITDYVAPPSSRQLITEVESALGVALHNSTSSISEIGKTLRTTFNALPKNAMGKIDHSAASYLLNRFFVHRHGWVIRGLQPNISFELASKAPILHMLEGRVPIRVKELFERHVYQDGWSLNDLAVFTALLEHLIDEETVGRLEEVYKVKNITLTETIDSATALAVAELYMMFYIQGYESVDQFAQSKINQIVASFEITYPAWPKAHQLLQQILQEVPRDPQSFRFPDVVRALKEAVNHFYDRVQKEQCQQTKGLLLQFEDHGSGRVKLLDFYHKAINEDIYQFTETVDFLRQTGALDESDPLVPRVIISNYVSGQSNCVARTSEYAVCCPDDCEMRFMELEHKLGKPSASSAEILDLQEQISTRGQMTPLLVKRLNDIAELHGGIVPIYGRLFRQWMHSVHPAACIYPYKTGAVYTKTMEEWEEATGMRTGALTQEIHEWSHALADNQSQRDAKKELPAGLIGMWTMDEELVVYENNPLVSEATRAANARLTVSIIISAAFFFSRMRQS